MSTKMLPYSVEAGVFRDACLVLPAPRRCPAALWREYACKSGGTVTVSDTLGAACKKSFNFAETRMWDLQRMVRVCCGHE